MQPSCFFFTVRFEELRCITAATARALLRVETESSRPGPGFGWSLAGRWVLLLRLLIREGLLLAWGRWQRMAVDLRRHCVGQEFVVFLWIN